MPDARRHKILLDEEQQVTYQLKRGDDGWLVLYREYRQPSGPAR